MLSRSPLLPTRTRALVLCLALLAPALALTLAPTGAVAAPTVEGREWRELYLTTGLSWSEVSSVCPRDGATPCQGSVGGHDLTGWTWASAEQVLDLMDDHAPGLATADPPVVEGIDGFWGAISFLGVMRWTTYTSLTYFSSEWTGGWTSSRDEVTGQPIGGGAGYSHRLTGSTAEGSIGLGAVPDEASPVRGVFLWRPVGADVTAPVVTASVAGTRGTDGWYRSDVSVTWDVSDPESPITSRTGCDPTSLTADTPGATLTCEATSVGLGGTGRGSVTIRRDATAPTLTCSGSPVVELGAVATVSAVVSDATSGPVAATVTRTVPTSTPGTRSVVLEGSDRAGNTGTRSCGYEVVVGSCQGRTPTIIGTAGAEVLTGTPRSDVIVGLGGGDTVYGLGGADVVCGGEGGDTLFGGEGNDTLDGGAGVDAIRGDGGYDRCSSGEIRMSSCAVVF